MSWFTKLKNGLQKTASGISNVLKSKKKFDDVFLDELEDSLLMTDMGIDVTSSIMSGVRSAKFSSDASIDDVKLLLKDSMMQILQSPDVHNNRMFEKLSEVDSEPFIIMICGVNGNGKTTTTGKLAKLIQDQGKNVMLAGCDTFRAAAIEQLRLWSEKIGCKFFTADNFAEPASVVYKAYRKAKEDNVDVLIIDTAGRMHNNADLMAELQKCDRVIEKARSYSADEVLLVLDATTGQTAYKQLESFGERMNLTGLILTKMDGSSKGGVVLGLSKKYKIPICAVGIGEKAEDLQIFDPEVFINSLLDLK